MQSQIQQTWTQLNARTRVYICMLMHSQVALGVATVHVDAVVLQTFVLKRSVMVKPTKRKANNRNVTPLNTRKNVTAQIQVKTKK